MTPSRATAAGTVVATSAGRPRPLRLLGVVLSIFATALLGCSRSSPLPGTPRSLDVVSVSLHGGQQPVSGATLQLYAVGLTGDGAAATPLFAHPPVSDANGFFFFGGLFTCPSPSSLVYLVATGGNPGLPPGGQNPALALMAILGPCSDIESSTTININELTTVAAVFALAPFMQRYDAIGSTPANSALLSDSFSIAGELVSTASGAAPGASLPPGQVVPIAKLHTLANILASCVNSAGGAAGDQTACGLLFSAATPLLAVPPTDTVQAALSIAQTPTRNLLALFSLASPRGPFLPMLAQPPDTWDLSIASSTLPPVFAPSPGVFSAPPAITLSDATPSAKIFYTTDGSTPSAASAPFLGAFVLPVSATLRAVAIANGVSSVFSLGSYVIQPPSPEHLVFLTQPADSAAAVPLLPAPVVAVEDSAGNVVTGAAGVVTLQLGSGAPAAALGGTTTIPLVQGTATFADLTVTAPAAAYSLQASSTGRLPASSASFAVANSLALAVSQNTLAIGNTVAVTLTSLPAAPSTGLTTTLTSSNPTVIAVSTPALLLTGGAASASFNVTALGAGSATITVTAPGYTPATLQLAATPPPVPSTFFGLSVQNFQNVQPLLSFGTTRSWDSFANSWDSTPGLDWPHISPSRGIYNFAALDSFIAINQARGTEMIYTFGRTPQWASASPDAPGIYGPGQCAPPAQLADWDSFVTALATRSNGRIRFWELWNEPTYAQSYCGDIPTMVTLSRHASQIIKSIDPNAVILSPSGTDTNGPPWLESFFVAGGSSVVDVIAFHGYWSATAEDINAVIGSYRAVAARHNLGSKPLWDTEASWAGLNNGLNTSSDPTLRSAFLAKYFLLHWSQGVSRFLWYAYDGQPVWGQLWDSTNLLHPDGVAFRETYRWMVGATMASPCAPDNSGTWTCTLTRPGGYQALVLWNSTSTQSFRPAPGYTEYRDLSGAVHSLAGSPLAVSNLPILLETAPLP